MEVELLEMRDFLAAQRPFDQLPDAISHPEWLKAES